MGTPVSGFDLELLKRQLRLGDLPAHIGEAVALLVVDAVADTVVAVEHDVLDDDLRHRTLEHFLDDEPHGLGACS